MGIQLKVQALLLIKKWRFLLFLITFPSLVLMLLLPFMSLAITESRIPIAWADQDKTDFSKLVLKRISEHERLKVIPVTEMEGGKMVNTGEVEAAFIIEKGFEKQLKTGEADPVITWLRSDSSGLDGFAKEKIAAEAMRLMMNSKAAEFVEEYNSEFTWDKAFEFADQYWEPEPLFRMDFVWVGEGREAKETTLKPEIKGILSFFLIYAMGVGVALKRQLFADKESGLYQRISQFTGHIHFYDASSVLLHITVSFIVMLPGFVFLLFYYDFSFATYTGFVYKTLIILAGFQLFLLILSKLIHKRRLYFAISFGILCAFFLFVH
ncbi:ABC transporter permease [Thalassobacillus pellis]|uniref:ABC transporter permease n=1 Tax=Thalassobacillus pellis TaxID=748008 RepID=UPI00195FB900|nr:ABC transporter permease [Thalassobacillus pellis]MBM7551182.1 hypothetical protein [Thalassobacillus pellis]